MRFKTFNALCWFIHAAFFSFCIFIYWTIFPNYLSIINLPQVKENNIVALWIVGYFQYFVILIIPILFYWLINFMLVWVLSKTLPSILIQWFFSKTLNTKLMKMRRQNKNKISNEKTFLAMESQVDMENLNRIKEGDLFQFLQKTVIHFFILVPFVGWLVGLIYFGYTIIFNKKIYFMSYRNLKITFKNKMRNKSK